MIHWLWVIPATMLGALAAVVLFALFVASKDEGNDS